MNRIHQPAIRGSSQAIYCLDREGLPVAAEILSVPPTSISWKYKHRNVNPLFFVTSWQ
jgi:hypothetical protein